MFAGENCDADQSNVYTTVRRKLQSETSAKCEIRLVSRRRSMALE